MLKSVWVGGTALAVLCASVARADGPDKAKEGPEPTGRRVIVQAVGGQPGGPIEVFELRKGDEKEKSVWLSAPKVMRVSDYWIGLECYPAEPALAAQLKLPEGQGLVVHHVAPESPAAKAGLKQYDVLVKAGGKPVGKVGELVDAVEAAKDKSLSLEIVREAKPKKIDVKAAKRPEHLLPGGPLGRAPIPVPGNPDLEALRKWYEHLKPGAGPPMQFRFFQPGTILPRGAPVHPPLPGNMSVAISKHGDEPAKIVVSQDGKKWEVTEKELDKLPKDVRAHVERMLGRIPPVGPGDFDIDVDVVPHPPGAPLPGPVPVPGKQFKNEMDRMHRQIEELRKAVEQMQGKADEAEKPKSR